MPAPTDQTTADAAKAIATLELIQRSSVTDAARLGLIESARTSLVWLERSVVEHLRSSGWTWQQIATELGTTRQAAQQRFSAQEAPTRG